MTDVWSPLSVEVEVITQPLSHLHCLLLVAPSKFDMFPTNFVQQSSHIIKFSYKYV